MSQERILAEATDRLMRKCLVGLILCCLLWPAVGWSQRVLTLTPSLTTGVRYDDNIFQDADDEVDDFIFVVAPGIELHYLPGEATDVTFAYRPTLNFFVDNTSENFVGHRLSLVAMHAFSRRLVLNVDNGFLYTQEPFDRERRVEVEDTTREVSDDQRGRTIRNVLASDLRFQLAPRTAFSLLFSSLIEDVDNPSDLDEYRFVPGAAVSYLTHIARQNRISLTYTAGFFLFSDNDGVQAEPEEDFVIHTVSAGYNHNFNPTLRGNVSISYNTTVSDDDDIDGDSGVGGGVQIVKTLRTGQVSAGYRREFTSGGGRGDQVIDDRVALEIRSNVTPKIEVALAGSVAFVDFQRDDDEDRYILLFRPRLAYQMSRLVRFTAAYRLALTDYDDGDRSDRLVQNFTFETRFTLRAGLFLSLTYNFRDRRFDSVDTDPREDDEFTRNRIMLSVTYRPTFRF